MMLANLQVAGSHWCYNVAERIERTVFPIFKTKSLSPLWLTPNWPVSAIEEFNVKNKLVID